MAATSTRIHGSLRSDTAPPEEMPQGFSAVELLGAVLAQQPPAKLSSRGAPGRTACPAGHPRPRQDDDMDWAPAPRCRHVVPRKCSVHQVRIGCEIATHDDHLVRVVHLPQVGFQLVKPVSRDAGVVDPHKVGVRNSQWQLPPCRAQRARLLQPMQLLPIQEGWSGRDLFRGRVAVSACWRRPRTRRLRAQAAASVGGTGGRSVTAEEGTKKVSVPRSVLVESKSKEVNRSRGSGVVC